MLRFEPKTLVIGSSGHNGELESYKWEDSRIQELQFDDFNTIVLNLYSLPSNVIDANSSLVRLYREDGNGKLEILTDLDLMTLKNLQFLDHMLYKQGLNRKLSVVFLVNPSHPIIDAIFNSTVLLHKSDAEDGELIFTTTYPNSATGTQLTNFHLDLITPGLLTFHEDPNVSMINSNPVFQPYFSAYKYYEFVFQSPQRITPLAHTFYNATIAFLMSIHNATLFFLPHPKMYAPSEVVEVFIRKVLGILDDQNLEFPSWTEKYKTQTQQELLQEIKELEDEIQFLEQRIQEKGTRYAVFQAYQRVLFVHGKLLVTSVHDLLLGINFKQLKSYDVKYQFEVISDEIHLILHAVSLEDNVLQRKPLRSLNQWVEEREEELKYQEKVKGILIVAYEQDKDPEDRTPLQIDDMTQEYIRKNNLCYLTAVDLFNLFRSQQSGIIGTDSILKMLVNTKGRARISLSPNTDL